MSLQSEITTWRDAYDETGIGTHNPAYIGSILAVNGNYYTGNGIYDPSAAAPTYEIYDFNWYAGQGIDSNTSFGGKYLLYSESGFSWDTTYNSAIGSYSFVTNGSLDNLYLGYNPTSDTGVAPAASTLTTFDAYEPLLVVSGFDIAVDAVASSVFGVADGNSAISVSNSTFSGILANASLYDSATLNSAVIYSLAFDNTDISAFEFVLDNYLGSLGVDIDTATWAQIDTALADTGVSIAYYDEAGDYASGGVITEALASAAAVESDLLLAA